MQSYTKSNKWNSQFATFTGLSAQPLGQLSPYFQSQEGNNDNNVHNDLSLFFYFYFFFFYLELCDREIKEVKYDSYDNCFWAADIKNNFYSPRNVNKEQNLFPAYFALFVSPFFLFESENYSSTGTESIMRYHGRNKIQT